MDVSQLYWSDSGDDDEDDKEEDGDVSSVPVCHPLQLGLSQQLSGKAAPPSSWSSLSSSSLRVVSVEIRVGNSVFAYGTCFFRPNFPNIEKEFPEYGGGFS